MSGNLIPRLASQFAQGRVILFTGAGFSLDAQSRSGKRVPTAGQLRDELWELAFPGESHDGSGLQDTFEAAVSQAERPTIEMLRDRLTIDSQTLAEHYKTWFSMPWYRVYTLNIDDLEEAAASAFDLPRDIAPVSALSDSFVDVGSRLQVVHLNGRLSDLPTATFSGRQYAERLARSDAWYANLSRELSSHPFLFVGTTLDEPPLWQYVEERGNRRPRTREFRPASCLVTPNLPRAKCVALGRYNVDPVDMKAGEFADDVLSKMDEAAAEGLQVLAQDRRGREEVLQRVETVRNDQQGDAREFLTGREPRWSDITDGYAVEREFDRTLTNAVGPATRLLVVTGTAGSGKSTSAMRLALSFSGEGKAVARLSPDSPRHARKVRDAVTALAPDVLLIDDADRFGDGLPALIADLRSDVPGCVFVCALRSARYESTGLSRLVEAQGDWAVEQSAPPLADSDVDDLLDALTSANRLGELKNQTRARQRKVLVDQCGRQLLVALIEATSGLRLDQKVESECRELGGDSQLLYAVAALATNFSVGLRDAELLAAVADDPGTAVRAMDVLVRTHLLVRDGAQKLRLRHRVIAERTVEYFRAQRLIEVPYRGLVASLAAVARARPLRDTPQGRATIRLINHKVLIDFIRVADGPHATKPDVAAIRGIYEEVETLLSDDYHYWLQRSSFETEVGSLDLAMNFVSQARGLNGDDAYVRAQWAYATLKSASRSPNDPQSRDRAQAAFAELDEAIAQRGRRDSYPFHIYGSQGLGWSNRATLTRAERIELLLTLRRVVGEGIGFHPTRRDLRQLASDLQAAYLNLATDDGDPGSATGT
jgi:hypothetical protein